MGGGESKGSSKSLKKDRSAAELSLKSSRLETLKTSKTLIEQYETPDLLNTAEGYKYKVFERDTRVAQFIIFAYPNLHLESAKEELMYTFPIKYLRGFGQLGSLFSFETGSKCQGGNRIYTFEVEDDTDLFEELNKIIKFHTGGAGMENRMTHQTSSSTFRSHRSDSNRSDSSDNQNQYDTFQSAKKKTLNRGAPQNGDEGATYDTLDRRGPSLPQPVLQAHPEHQPYAHLGTPNLNSLKEEPSSKPDRHYSTISDSFSNNNKPKNSPYDDRLSAINNSNQLPTETYAKLGNTLQKNGPPPIIAHPASQQGGYNVLEGARPGPVPGGYNSLHHAPQAARDGEYDQINAALRTGRK